jgi:hypothetical protein
MPSDEEVTTRAGSLRAMTGLTAQAFQALLPPFAQALGAYLRDPTMDGPPRTVRRSRTYDPGPVPTSADQLLCMRTYFTQHPLQEVQGQLLGRSPSNTHKWSHRLPIGLPQA